MSLENITGIDGRMETYEKASQTDKYFEDETPEYFLLLEQIADDLGLSEDITENYDGDEADAFIK